MIITAVPITKLFAWGEGDSGGHVLRETTSRGLSGLVCPSRTSERGGEGYCVKGGGGGVAREEPGTLTQGAPVCVECLFLRSTSRAPYRTPSACAKRATYPDPPPRSLLPESIAAQAAYAEALLPGLAPARNLSRHWGPPRACYRVLYCG